VQPANVGLPGK